MSSPLLVEFVPGRMIPYDPATRLLVKGRTGAPAQGVQLAEMYAGTPTMAVTEALSQIAGLRTRGSTPWSAWDLVRCPADRGAQAQAWADHGSPLGWAGHLTHP